ncbi:hypothetical protein ACAG25_03715 [Mycobacterium sp. pV006]|uniref:hypothetical protein n=1 Tax=Mycobacterium sp. pV006 TaxID=3238983 RepID=UPI00351B8670
MTKVVAATLVLMMGAGVLAAMVGRQWILPSCGVALAAGLASARWRLTHPPRGADPEPEQAADAALRRWLARTETLISWSESSRADWDRRLRPLLARQFELTAGTRKARDPNAFAASGRMLFGPQLWEWVDPENVSRTGTREPGPGRDTLDEILRRLEQL